MSSTYEIREIREVRNGDLSRDGMVVQIVGEHLFNKSFVQVHPSSADESRGISFQPGETHYIERFMGDASDFESYQVDDLWFVRRKA